jgi:hypothetical protein
VRRWATVLVAAAVHPAWLGLMLPLLGDRANLESIVAPLLAVWLLNLRTGLGLLLVNAVTSSIVFTLLYHQGPREGLPKTFVATFVMAFVCWVAAQARRYVDKGRLMREEIERMRDSGS